MKTFTVNTENQIAMAVPAASISEPSSGEFFSTQAELVNLAGGWPAGRLIAVWNGLPGVVPVKKFTDRKTAVKRIWKAIQSIWPDSGAEGPAVAPPAGQISKPRGRAKKPATGRDGSKTAQVIRLLKRASGATLAELIEATSWQPHTVRGFISGGLTKRRRMPVESSRREDGARVYKIRS